MKLEYIVVPGRPLYENILDKCDNGHYQVKVKVTAQLKNFSPFAAIQTVWSHNSTLI